MKITTIEELKNCLNSYYSYGMFGTTKDMGHLCEGCITKEIQLIENAISEKFDQQWEVIAIESYDIDPDEIFCDHCHKDISVYATDLENKEN